MLSSEYSIIVKGAVDTVESILRMHDITLVKGDYFGNEGYVIKLKEDSIGAHPVIQKLRELPNVILLSRSFSAIKE